MTEKKEKSSKNLEEEIILLKRELEIANLLNEKITMDMDFDSLMDEIIFTLREKVNFDGCNFSFLDEFGFMKVHKISHSKMSKKTKATKEFLDKIYSQRIDIKISKEWASRVANEDIEIHYPEIKMDDFTPDERYLLENYGITSFYYLPIKLKGKILGTMRFHNYGETMFLSEMEKNLIRKRTALVARALENHRIYNELKRKNEIIKLDLSLAKRIQQNLIPHDVPQYDGIDIAAEYLPMQEVGGDYYDFINNKSEKEKGFGVIITDASGHGVPAAFITSMMKISFQGKRVYTKVKEPGAVMREINSEIKGKIADNFVSGIYCYFDLSSMKMSTVRCGHNPMLVIDRKTGDIDTINPIGGLLGFFDELEAEEMTVDLKRDSRYFLFTDGLTDATNSEGEFFEETLYKLCKEYHHLKAAEFTKRIVDDMKEFSIYGSKTSFDDDTAIVTIDVD